MVFGQLVMPVQCCVEAQLRRCLSAALHKHDYLAKVFLGIRPVASEVFGTKNNQDVGSSFLDMS